MRSPAARRAFNLGSIVVATLAVLLTIRHFQRAGWPMHHANAWLVLLAGELFVLAYGAKAIGWQRLFATGRRPRVLTLAAAGGAASVGGIALPGRFDEVIRIAVVRRCRRTRASLGAVGLSLFLLGLLDSAALTPLASVAAAVSSTSTVFRVGLAVVAAAGVVAAIVVLGLPRLAAHRRVAHLGAAAWAREQCAPPRAAIGAGVLVALSWVLRGAALFVLLAALSMHATVPLALAVLCASAASAALPIAPAGQATQAGAGAAVLVASGVPLERAVAFAVSAQSLVVLAGALLVLVLGTEHAGARLRSALAR